MASPERFTTIYKKANRKMICDVYHIIVTDLLVHIILKHITINLLFSNITTIVFYYSIVSYDQTA